MDLGMFQGPRKGRCEGLRTGYPSCILSAVVPFSCHECVSALGSQDRIQLGRVFEVGDAAFVEFAVAHAVVAVVGMPEGCRGESVGLPGSASACWRRRRWRERRRPARLWPRPSRPPLGPLVRSKQVMAPALFRGHNFVELLREGAKARRCAVRAESPACRSAPASCADLRFHNAQRLPTSAAC